MTDKPTLVSASSVHPLSADLLRKPKDQYIGLMPMPPAPRPGLPDYTPEVAGGVADLQAAFAHAITPTEIAWAQGKVPDSPLNDAPAPPPAPLKFKNAYHAIIDQLLMDPSITVTRLSTVTGYSRTWLHKVMSSDSFQAQLASRQKNCVDDHIRTTVMDRLAGLGSRALEILEERLDGDKVDTAFALEVAQFTTKAQGLGQPKAAAVQNFIVQVPVPVANATEWAAQHAPTVGGPPVALSEPIDITPNVQEAEGVGATDE